MRSHSLLHPNHARKLTPTNQQTGFQAPDIFVVPPEEDEIPPWCCYNAQQGINNEDDHDQSTARYYSAHNHTSYFHTGAPGLEDFMPSNSKDQSDTRSIVDALGDADDGLENEFGYEPGEPDLEDEDGVEFGLYDRSHQGSPLQRVHSTEPPSPRKDVGNDSDIIEVVKVRRRGSHLSTIGNDFFGPSGNGHSDELNTKSSFRSRATKAFLSLRGTIRPSSKTSSKYKDSVGSYTKPKSTSNPRTTLQSKPRAQDIFLPPENNTPPPRESDTPDLENQPSSGPSQLLLPALKRRPSSPFFTALRSTTKSQSAQGTTFVRSTPPPTTPGSHTPPTPPQSSSSSHARQGPTYQEVDDRPTPTRNTYQPQSEGCAPTPSNLAHEADDHTRVRSISPMPSARSVTPGPSIRQASKSFSVRNLHKIFHKSTPSDTPHPQVPSTNSASSICPSLSSTSTSEWSEPATPADSLSSAPTSVDEGEVGQDNISTPGASTSSSIRTIGGNGCTTARGRTSGEMNRSETPIPDFDLSPEFTLNLDLGLDIHHAPSPTDGTTHSFNGKGKSKPRAAAASLSRSLSLKNIGSKLRIGKQQAPPVPPLPVPGSLEDGDTSMEMRLDSFHFDDLSFDTNRFVSR